MVGADEALGVAVIGAAYVGYEAYQKNERDQQEESERIRAELDDDPVSLVDRANQMSEQPRWNGPGIPALGIGNEPGD